MTPLLFRLRQRPGVELIFALTMISVVTAIALAALQIAVSQSTLNNRDVRLTQIDQIAESGANYYRWRLAHYPNDYQDGTNVPGPYIHDFKDGSGKVIGQYQLTITPPALGSTITTVTSVGYLMNKPNTKRVITVKLGVPSLSKYAVVSTDFLRFGAGTVVNGPIHSNNGIHFDGVANGLVSSAVNTYNDPDGYGTKPGVWSLVNPDTSVFLGGKQYPVAPIDFASITTDLNNLQTAAQTNGIYLPFSNNKGYHLTLRTDGKIDMRVVKVEQSCQFKSGGNWYDYGYCSNNYKTFCVQNSTCGSGNTCVKAGHSIGTAAADQETFLYNGGSSLGVALPANGIIFASDDVWVDGQINNARVTIVAAKLPVVGNNLANIYLTKNLTYTNYDGSDVIGLIAQNDILAGYFSNNVLQVDGAMIAQNGRVGRPYFGSGFINSTNNSNFQIYPIGESNPNGTSTCQEYRMRDSLTLNGSMATNKRYGFAWLGGTNPFDCPAPNPNNNSGYCARNLNFDSNLIFGPPPLFPTTGQYSVISYSEKMP